MQNSAWQWDYEYPDRWRRRLESFWRQVSRPLGFLVVACCAFVAGVVATAGPEMALKHHELRDRLEQMEVALRARQGELTLVRHELARVHGLMDYSARHGIPADLAALVFDIALAEGIDPDIAYGLVRVESAFAPNAVSHMGAVGLAQLMPPTAYELDPALGYHDLFDPETNLRLGFRYLRLMLERYQGDLRMALLAYNRGPGTVDALTRAGVDPGNGYDREVLRSVGGRRSLQP